MKRIPRSRRRALRRREMQPPLRNGINAARVKLPAGSWQTLAQWATDSFGQEARSAFARGDFTADCGAVLSGREPYRAGARIWVFRPVKDEPPEPLTLPVVFENERIVVIDKPHGMATIPRGSHVAQTVTVAARRQFGNDDIVCAHRLDLETAGLVLLIKKYECRRAYQQLFDRRQVSKTYLAAAAPHGDFPPGVRGRYILNLYRPSGQPNVEVWEEGTPLPAGISVSRSVTDITFKTAAGGIGLYELHPRTGYLHQLRAVMNHLGVPICGDPLYPRAMTLGEQASRPYRLQLLAQELSFSDPYTGREMNFRSRRGLACISAPG